MNTNAQITLDSEVTVFINTAGGGQSSHTRRAYHSGLAHLLAYLRERGGDPTAPEAFARLTLDLFQEFPAWLTGRTYRPTAEAEPVALAESSRALYLVAVSRFITFLAERKRLPHLDPGDMALIRRSLRDATNVKTAPIAMKIPPDDIVAALVEAARQEVPVSPNATDKQRRQADLIQLRNLAIVLVFKSSGVRVGELVALGRATLDYTQRGAWVKGKGRKTRFVAFSDEAWAALQDYFQERQDGTLAVPLERHPVFCRHGGAAPANSRLPLTERAIWNIIDALATQAQVAERFHIHPHSLRHYFANRLLAATNNLALTQDALGHQDPKTTRVYTHIKPEQIAEAVRAIG